MALPSLRRRLTINTINTINQRFEKEQAVKVVLLSKNAAITRKRVFHSIQHYDFSLSGLTFKEDMSPDRYIPVFNALFFPPANEQDVVRVNRTGFIRGSFI